MVKDLYRYIWKVSARDQVLLSLLAVAIFLIELVPLELQRRIVNGAVEGRGWELVGTLCLVYAGVALLHGGLKLVMNVYRGSVSEAANQRLRLQMNPSASAAPAGAAAPGEEGVKISMIVSEVESVGGFVGSQLLGAAAQRRHAAEHLRVHGLHAALDGAGRACHLLAAAPVHSVPAGGDQPAHQAAHRDHAGAARRYRQGSGRSRGRAGARNLPAAHRQCLPAEHADLRAQARHELPDESWNDLVDFFRNLTNTGVKFRMISAELAQPEKRQDGKNDDD